jgi:hypothetical protein
MKNSPPFRLVLLCLFFFSGIALKAQIEFDSTSYQELNLTEDIASSYALEQMFIASASDTLSYRVTRIVGNGIIDAKINSSQDSIVFTPQENRFGQALVTVSATNSSTDESLEQEITIIVSPVDDEPEINSENPFEDLAYDQLDEDQSVYIDLTDRFTDVDEDEIIVTVAFENKATTSTNFTTLESDAVTIEGDSIVVGLSASSKYALQLEVTATSNDSLFVIDSFDLIVDDAPVQQNATIDLDEDFSVTKYALSELFSDDDETTTDYDISFDDYLDDDDYGYDIIENDTNRLVLVRYLLTEDSLELTSKANAFGEYDLPIELISGERTVSDTLTFVVSNVDDKPEVKNGIVDQLLPKNRELRVALNEVFDDIDNDIDYDDASLVIDNPTPFVFKDLEGNTLTPTGNTLDLSADDSVVVISVSDAVDYEGEQSIFSLELDITDAFSGADPITDIFEITVSRAVVNLYVSGTEGDDGNDGLSGNPVATIQKAIEIGQIGDTINIATGTYQENISIEEGLIVRSEIYSSSMSESDIEQTVIKGNVNGGSVVNVLRTEGFKLYGVTIAGSDGDNTRESSVREWKWTGNSSYSIDENNWNEGHYDNVPNDPNTLVYAVINPSSDEIESRSEWDWHQVFFEVPAGTSGSFTSNNTLKLTNNGKDIYLSNSHYDLNAIQNYLQSNVPDGELLTIDDQTQYDLVMGLTDDSFYMIGLINKEVINGYGAGLYAQEASMILDKVIIENHENGRSSWDNAAGILAFNARQIEIRNSVIRNNTVQNGEAVGIGVFWSDDLKISNTWIYNNEVNGDNHCTTGGLLAQNLRNLTITNSIFLDNEQRCGHEVRIAGVENYNINHSIISKGVNFQDVENYTGLLQNSIILSGDVGNWGPTKPSKLKIRNNLMNANIWLDFEISEYGKNNIFGSNAGFTDGENKDFSLLSTSILIGAGKSSSATLDILGNERPSPGGSLPDIGPYENALSAPELIFRPYTYYDATQESDVQMRFETSENWYNTYSIVEMVDADQDGTDEIIFNENLGQSQLKLLAADGNKSVLHEDWNQYTMVKPMDLNQDGWIDLVIANHNKIGYIFNNGSGLDPSTFEEHSEFGFSPYDAESLQWADMTSDGRLDAILPEYSGVRIYDFDREEPSQQNIQLNNLDNEWLGDFGDAFVADLNGDLRMDLILERRWYNQESKDLLIFIQNRNSFEYREDLSLIDVLEVPADGDRSFDLQVVTGDLDEDNLMDMIVGFEPGGNTNKGYLRRFELENDSWSEVPTLIRVDADTAMNFHDVFDVFINFKMVAFTEDNQMELFGFASDERPENNDWERYYEPTFLTLNEDQEFVIKQGYYSQEIFRTSNNDAYTRPHYDFGSLNDDDAYDLVVVGRKDNGKNAMAAFTNTYDYTSTGVTAPGQPSLTVRGSKLTINFTIESPYFNIRLCKDGTCNDLLVTSDGALVDKSSAIYTGSGEKELTYFLNEGTYNVDIQAINHHLEVSEFVSSDTVEVSGLKFLAGNTIFNDFFNSVNLINIDNDEEPEVYGFKKRFWYNGGERPSSLRIFNFDDANTSKDYVLDNTGETPLISDFDLNGYADIILNTGDCNWPQKPYSTLFNIDETTSVPVFSESFSQLNIALDGGNCGAGITNTNILVDIDQDGRDEVLTAVVNEWDQNGLSIFALESDDFDRNIILNSNGSDVYDWNGEDFDGVGAIIKSKIEQSGRGSYRGMAHTYLDPDNDGDADHLLAINMQKGNPIAVLYLIETLGAGRVRAHYLNHFIDRSIIHLETVRDDDQTTKVIISTSDDTNYWLDAYSTTFVNFLSMDITNSPSILEDMFDDANKDASAEIVTVNYKQNGNTNISYSEYEFEGIPLANIFETGDINNDGLTDVVVVGSNSYDTWNASALLNIYLQNEDGAFDPYISSIRNGVKAFSFISSLNMIDINGDAQFDIVASGRLRFSNDGATIGFVNQTNELDSVALTAPSSLAGQNNGYKVQLDWSDSNEGAISYAVQIGNTLNDYNISLGKLNQNGAPLFPDRFEAFHPSQSLTFDAYDLADRYYFRIKSIDQYGNTSDFSEIQEVTLSQPFTLMDQSIPGLEEGNVAWGDYDRDGDLDLSIMGKEDGFTTAIYRNDSGTFVNTNQNLFKQSKGDLEWVDYDNDGYLDLIVVGLNPQLLPSLNIYKNINGNTFVRQNNSELPGLTDATLAFGDADADGDMDMVVAGIGQENGNITYAFKLYTNRHNEGSSEVFEISPNFEYEGFVNGDIEFADLDNDGDLDIVYAGTGRGDVPVGGIIVNTRVGLAESNNSYLYSHALALKEASISVGDIDLDGDLDLLTTGITSNYNGVEENVTKVLYNNFYRIDSLRAYINFREELSNDITPLVDGDLDMIDFDNDGDLDVLASGADEFGNPQTLLYAQRSGDFFPVNAGFEHLSQSSVKWADFDTDGDMDVFISGKSGTISQTLLYENNTGNLINHIPETPTNLQVTDYGYGKIKLSWDKATDDYTSKTSLSYVIALGTESGKSTKFTTESNLETGYRLSPKPSSTVQNFLYLELDPGNYYFSVQAVDANYAGSGFSEEIAFDVTYIWKELNLGGIVDNTLPAGDDASVKFSDFDGDGDFDLAIFGKNPNNQYELGLLQNKGGAFEKIYDFDPITKGDFDWADINGDGQLDLFMTGEDPYDETQVKANLYINRTPIINKNDTTFDGQFRWSNGELFEEGLITWQYQTPNQDWSYYAYGYLDGSYPPQMYDVAGDADWYSGSALIQVPVDYSVSANGIWRWQNGNRQQSYITWADDQPWVDQYSGASEAHAVMHGNGLHSEPSGNGANHPALLEISSSTSVSQEVLNTLSFIGTFGDKDYYSTFDFYSATDIFENVANYYDGFELLEVSTFDEWGWVQENMGSLYGWIGLKVAYPLVFIDNISVYYQGIYNNKNYYRFDFYNGPNTAVSVIKNSFPTGAQLFVPDDQDELEYVLEKFGSWGLVGVVRKGFPAGFQDAVTNFQNSNLNFEPLVNAKVKFTDIDNNGTPELIYAGSTSSTSIGRPALKIYKFLEDGFNFTQREVQLSQELPNLTESSIEFGDIDKDRDIDIVLSGFDPFSGRRTVIFKNDGLDAEGRLVLTEDQNNNLVGVQNGTIDLIDFDNDGDLDMVISGDSKTGDILEIYQNDNGIFNALSASLEGVEAMKNGRTSWGDFNGDGYADILYSGEVLGKGEFTGLAVYNADSGTFYQDEFDLSQFANAAVAFGDYDDDNDLDMVLTGTNKFYDEFDPGSEKYISKLYVNVRNESALITPIDTTLSIAGESTFGLSTLASNSEVNEAPTTPVAVDAQILQDTTASGLRFVELSWEAASDDFTSSAGLTYALRVGTTPGGNDVLDAQANEDGTRRVSGKGNVEHNTSWKLSLESGTYYWSVQALDASYSASDFSEEKTFILTESGEVEINMPPVAKDTTFVLRLGVEVGYNLGSLDVSDPNEDNLIFSILSGNDDGVFSIGQSTGSIVLFDGTQIDTANVTQYLLDVLVSDGVYSDTALVTINIEAQNNAPEADDLTFQMSIDEVQGYEVGQVSASDLDDDALTYEIVTGNSLGIFGIDASSGQISILDPDQLVVTTYNLTIEVTDGYDAVSVRVVVIVNSVLGTDDWQAGIRVYPNPTAEVIYIQSDLGAGFNIQLRDMSGKSLIDQDMNQTTEIIDISKYKAGIYLMMIKSLDESKMTLKKIIKQ